MHYILSGQDSAVLLQASALFMKEKKKNLFFIIPTIVFLISENFLPTYNIECMNNASSESFINSQYGTMENEKAIDYLAKDINSLAILLAT